MVFAPVPLSPSFPPPSLPPSCSFRFVRWEVPWIIALLDLWCAGVSNAPLPQPGNQMRVSIFAFVSLKSTKHTYYFDSTRTCSSVVGVVDGGVFFSRLFRLYLVYFMFVVFSFSWKKNDFPFFPFWRPIVCYSAVLVLLFRQLYWSVSCRRYFFLVFIKVMFQFRSTCHAWCYVFQIPAPPPVWLLSIVKLLSLFWAWIEVIANCDQKVGHRSPQQWSSSAFKGRVGVFISASLPRAPNMLLIGWDRWLLVSMKQASSLFARFYLCCCCRK